jgi:hypothetical protein
MIYNDLIKALTEPKHANEMTIKLNVLLTLCVKNMKENHWKYTTDNQITIADFCMAALYWNLAKNTASPFHKQMSEVFRLHPEMSGYFLTLDQELKWHL